MEVAAKVSRPSGPPLEMSFRRKTAEQVVTGLERPTNPHLLKRLAFDAAPETRDHGKTKLDEWLTQIAVIRLKPANRPISARAAFEWLRDAPFGGSQVENAAAMIRLLERRGPRRNAAAPDAVAARLRALHEALAARVSCGDAGGDLLGASEPATPGAVGFALRARPQ